MTSKYIVTMFTTYAQVSFTIAGLMAVAIAGDTKRRDYWFGHKARSLFIYISFLLILLPGFVSLGGLLPPFSDESIPSWPFLTGFLGTLYAGLLITFFFRKKNIAEPEEFKKLETRYSKVNSEIFWFGVILVLLSIIGYREYFYSSVSDYRFIEIGLGLTLLITVISGTLASVVLLRSADQSTSEEDEITVINDDPILNNTKEQPSLSVIVMLFIAAISFTIGSIFKDKK